MANVSTEKVRKHIAYLEMSMPELAIRSGLNQSTLRSMLRNSTTRESSATAVLGVRKVVPHPTKINAESRVECGCGFLSQRFGTIGLAKARAREHASTGR